MTAGLTPVGPLSRHSSSITLWAEAGECPNGEKLQGHLPTPVAVFAADNRKSAFSSSYTRSGCSGYLEFPGSPGVPKKQSATIAQRTASSSALLFRMAAIRDPGSVGVATRVLAIPVKRTDKRLLGYLTRQEMDALLGDGSASGLDDVIMRCY